VIYTDASGTRFLLDFAEIRGSDIESDLRDRDFTVNALAVNLLNPQELLDPLGGARDLWNKTLRACSSSSFVNDPVRVLRAVRIAAGRGLHILPGTRTLMQDAVNLLVDVSPERLRDEVFRILGGPQPYTSIRALDMLGVLPYVLPELLELKDIPQPQPHIQDVWGHTLNTLRNLEALLNILGPQHNLDNSSSLIMGLAVMRLGRYRRQISEHIQVNIVPDREIRPLLFLAALYHDIAKPHTERVDDNGRIRFLNHDQLGGGIVTRRGGELHLSNAEINRLQVIVSNHMRPTHLAREEKTSSRAIYRFFRDTGTAGIDICLLSLADLLATYGTTLPQERWTRQLDVVRSLMDAWWEHPEKQVRPPKVVTGHDLMGEFGLEPGPQIGRFLEMVREAQVVGDVKTQQDAFDFVRNIL
jgi:tRNA nucleotidyltransferase/poly(A) polymerase